MKDETACEVHVSATIQRCGKALDLVDPNDPSMVQAMVDALLVDLSTLYTSEVLQRSTHPDVQDQMRRAGRFLLENSSPRLTQSAYDHLRELAWQVRCLAHMHRSEQDKQSAGREEVP
ncbi:hypothetical protein ABT390_35590 [Streptomyces aurantiacus]|uniref:Uncharacterized protein n=1 Tax=Streptomyces aurantiacus JA 4570 TaxID=1286094 RepID=S4A3P6_9ACTN|nr:hypothetical protein [Streptomyces aurantiacus]EPH45335.1 hypothetical protein STRAU_1600 [Streptomyces aurantiacus JA 4570]